jgi:hypothetical protein
MEFITRMYFLNLYMPEKLTQAFDRQRMEVEHNIHRLEKICVELPDKQIYNRMSLGLRLKQLKIVLEWLGDCQKNLQQDKTVLRESL